MEELHPSQNILTPQQQSIDIFKIFANDKRLILYRPEWRQFTESVLSTILLSQCLYWYDKMGRRPFYKFKEPCQHQLYHEGDSWCEELGFSKREFDTALKHLEAKGFVEHHTDINRITYYSINEDILEPILTGIYIKCDSHFTKIPNPHLPPLLLQENNLHIATTTEPNLETVKIPQPKQVSKKKEGLLLLHHQDDVEKLKNLIPNHNLTEELSPQFNNIISKALQSHSTDSIALAITYTIDKSKGSPFEFKSYLGKTLLNSFHAGYVSKKDELRQKQEKQRQLENDRREREKLKALKERQEIEQIRLKDESRMKSLEELKSINPTHYREIQLQALSELKSNTPSIKFDIDGNFVKSKMCVILGL